MTDSAGQRWRILAALTFARTSMGYQFQSIAATAPVLAVQLNLSMAEIGFLVGLYLLPGLVFALPGGLLSARFGDRRIVLIGLAAMVVGGLMVAGATDVRLAMAGRLVGGAGGVLMNVALTKMVADWFAGRETVLAMSVLITAWPIGICLALFTLGSIASTWSPAVAYAATSVLAALGMIAVALFYRPAPGAPQVPEVRLSAFSRREWLLLSVGATPWMFYNAAYAIIVAFVPMWLAGAGLSIARAGGYTAINSLLVIVSVQTGGLLVQRFGRPNLVASAGLVGWALCLIGLMNSTEPLLWLVAGGLLGGLPAGILVSVPAEFLRPELRAAGMGVFYTLFYGGMALFPPLAGWLADRSGSALAPLYVALAALAAALICLAWTRWLQRPLAPGPGSVAL